MKQRYLLRFKEYHEAVEWIERIAPLKRPAAYGSDAHPRLAKERTQRFMALLGNPHRGFNTVHITGTSGKGSTAMMVGRMLQAAGRRTGIYVSPHTTTTIERFHGPDGLLMEPAVFVKFVQRLKPVIEQMDAEATGTPSYLEMMAGLAFLFFKSTRCEWVVLEVGMGGKRDATSIIPPPKVAAITPIGIDHAHLIGPTLADIAREKCGIIKRRTHTFTLEQRPALRAIIETHCHRVGGLWHPDLMELPAAAAPAMGGAYQASNARLAWTIGTHLGLSNQVMKQTVHAALLPCRFEIIQHRPTVILDGGHNPLAIRSVSQNLRATPKDQLILVAAFSESKDAAAMLGSLPSARELILTRFISSRSAHSPGALQRTLKTIDRQRCYHSIITELDPIAALKTALSHARRKDTVAVIGSLYLTGELRTRWVSEEAILKNRSSFL